MGIIWVYESLVDNPMRKSPAVLVPRSTSKSMTADFSQKEFVHLNGKPGRVHLRNLTLPTSWKFQMPPVPPRALEVIQANGSSWKLIVIGSCIQ
jgi:hypothetical protein